MKNSDRIDRLLSKIERLEKEVDKITDELADERSRHARTNMALDAYKEKNWKIGSRP